MSLGKLWEMEGESQRIHGLMPDSNESTQAVLPAVKASGRGNDVDIKDLQRELAFCQVDSFGLECIAWRVDETWVKWMGLTRR